MDMPDIWAAILTIATCIALSSIAYHRKILDRNGCILAFLMGALIGFFGHIVWLVVLLIFLFTSFGATKWRYKLKKKKKVAEPKGGKRGFENVLANGYVPTIIALLSVEYFPGFPHFPKPVAGVMFLISISAAASDTMASEIGVFSKRTYLITTFKRCRAGVNGGVSAFGTAIAFIASLAAALIGWVLLSLFPDQIPAKWPYLMLPVFLGFLGCHVDSILGATMENRYEFFTGSRVNLLSIATVAMIGYILMYYYPLGEVGW
jgi:uncharacterized protein (TIGR00297 family)